MAASVGFLSRSLSGRPPETVSSVRIPRTPPPPIGCATSTTTCFLNRYSVEVLTPTSTRSESHPEWAGKLDSLGLQYYFRAGVSGKSQSIPGVDAMICVPGFDSLDGGSCLSLEDDTKWVPSMSYEYFEPGLGNVLLEFADAYPEIPLAVTEAGIATGAGERRAENIVRSLEQI